VANAGAALYVAGTASTLREGVELARQAIDNGRALKKLEELIAVTRELA
jgi:anthranilate phosphoribosyltransferase